MIIEGDLLTCSLCSNSPIENYCVICESSFCKNCIYHWLSTNNTCPFCRYHKPQMNDIADTKPLRRILKKLTHDKLQVKHIEKAFKCSICRQLMKLPRSCSECKANFCLRCFQNKQIKENKCTSCKVINPKLKNLHKSLLDVLEKALLLCKYCRNPTPY